MSKSNKILITVAIILGVVYLYFGKNWWLRCPLYTISGWKCPLCGTQRAIYAAMHGNFYEAWQQNPMFWILLPYIFVLILGNFRYFQSNKIILLTSQNKVEITIVIIALIWGIIRNLITI